MNQILPATQDNILKAAQWIKAGEAVVFPTETLYGLAVDPRHPEGLQKLLRIKNRDPNQSVPLLVANIDMLKTFVARIPADALELIQKYWPGPLTLVLPAKVHLPPPVVSAVGGIGVRISSDPIAAALVEAVGGPITATSANISGKPPATKAQEVMIPEVIAILDDGIRRNPPSTVVEIMDHPKLIRSGAIQIEQLDELRHT